MNNYVNSDVLFSLRTQLVSTDLLTSQQQLDCLEEWVASQADVEIAGVSAQVCMWIDKLHGRCKV